jgi:hypothetical protein
VNIKAVRTKVPRHLCAHAPRCVDVPPVIGPGPGQLSRANCRVALFVCTLLALLLPTSPAAATYFETSVEPRADDRFKRAEYTLWVPDGVKQVRAVILHQHGCGYDGITLPRDLHWQALAAKYDAALIGTRLTEEGQCEEWSNPENGSGDAFLAALKSFARQSNHSELEGAPWVLWGHSGGAHWVIDMTLKYPERVVACFARSGGRIRGPVAPAPSDVPILFQLGGREKTDAFSPLFSSAHALFRLGRDRDANWSFAADPLTSHETYGSRFLAIPFFEACLAQRLPDLSDAATDGKGNPPAGEPVALRALDRSRAWLGDPETGHVAPVGEFKGDKWTAAWLPDEAVAWCWQQFVLTGSVADATPPPAPTRLVTRYENGAAVLHWSAAADVESGIKAFRVYRDGRLVAEVPEPSDAADHKRRAFQRGDAGDAPAPVDPSMQFVDPLGWPSSVYHVATVNHSDKESAMSNPSRAGWWQGRRYSFGKGRERTRSDLTGRG